MDPAMARMLAAARGGRPGEAPPAPGADAPVPDKYELFEFVRRVIGLTVAYSSGEVIHISSLALLKV